jgi:hypothetical protein
MKQALREAAGKVKRAPTAFNLFVKGKIAELRIAEPGLVQKEYMSKAANAWNEYKEANGMPATKVKPAKAAAAPRLQKPKAEKPPKRAPTAFNLFVKDKIAELRAAEPGLAQKEYMSKAAAAWNDHKVENGLPATKPKAPKDPNAPKRVPKPKKVAAEGEAEKPKRAPSAYNLFVKDKMAELRAAEPGLPAKEYMSKAAAAYRESKAI